MKYRHFITAFCIVLVCAGFGHVPAAPVDGWVVYGSREKVWLIKVDGGQHQPQQIHSRSNLDHACWSADGNYIYTITTDGKIHRLDNDGKNENLVKDTKTGCSRNPIATYRPDDNCVLYLRNNTGLFYKINALTGEQIEIFRGNRKYLGEIAIDKSGTRLAARDNSGGSGAWESHDPTKINLNTGQEKQYGYGCSPSISPDGKLLTENGTGLNPNIGGQPDRRAHTYMRCHEWTWANDMDDYIYEWFSHETYSNGEPRVIFDSQRFAANSNEWIVFMWDNRSGVAVLKVHQGIKDGDSYRGDIYNVWKGSSNALSHETHPDFWVGDLPVPASVAGKIQVASNSIRINENAGEATLKVQRIGGKTGSVSVDYTTADGSAKAGSDYTQKSGTLTWNDNDGNDKTIAISITDDTAKEGDEELGLTLSNAKTATLGERKVAITIYDDDSTLVDNQKPSNPGNFRQTFVSRSSADLAWNASSDNVKVTAYYLFQDGKLIDSTSSTNYSATGLASGTSFEFIVRAGDRAGNRSDASNTVSVTTLNATVDIPFKVNLAGGEYQDYVGDQEWADDKTYGYTVYGNETVISRAIGDTDDDEVYTSIRHIEVGYKIRVPNNTYRVSLLAAECWASGEGARIYRATLNGRKASVDPVDLYKIAGGPDKAIQIVTEVEVTDSLLTIELAREANSSMSPILAGIIVEPVEAFTLTSYNGGEQAAVGGTMHITWLTNQSMANEARLFLSPDEGSNWYELTTTEIAPTASDWENFAWKVPIDINGVALAGNQCLLKVTNYDGDLFDISDDFFTITASVNLASPDKSSAERAVRVTNTTGSGNILLHINLAHWNKAKLYSSQGRIIHTLHNSGAARIVLEKQELPKGVCWIAVEHGGQTLVRKIMAP
ncbi:MAG: hypothetical protein GF398_10150 [Chitinivibrionales bacterium]|nr:hypothetical protein [Chitinivibrionales bacterium]